MFERYGAPGALKGHLFVLVTIVSIRTAFPPNNLATKKYWRILGVFLQLATFLVANITCPTVNNLFGSAKCA